MCGLLSIPLPTSYIFRASRIGPLSKWVDDHIFFRVLLEHLADYNSKRNQWHIQIMANGGQLQDWSRLWYRGVDMPDGHPSEFDETLPFKTCPLIPHSHPQMPSSLTVMLTLITCQVSLAFHGKPPKLFHSTHVFPTLDLFGILSCALSRFLRKREPNMPMLSQNGNHGQSIHWRRLKNCMANSSMHALWSQKGGCTL